MSLRALQGQSNAQSRLVTALRRPSHAYLFTGAAATAKREAAIAFAQALICEQPGLDLDACGTCNTCRNVLGNGHPDVRVWDIAEGEKSFKVEQVRELIAAVSRKPYSAPRQIHIIAALDTMSLPGLNALLKTLEEPPSTTTLILLATDIESVLPTLVSRCQWVSFLAEVPPTGAVRPPLPRPDGVLAWSDAIAARPAEEQTSQLDALLRWLRDAALLAAYAETGLMLAPEHLLHPEHREALQSLAATTTAATWVAQAQAVEAARDALTRHANARLVLDRLARTLAQQNV